MEDGMGKSDMKWKFQSRILARNSIAPNAKNIDVVVAAYFPP